jgi:hypothetical protein
MKGDILAQRCEQTMPRIEQIANTGYQVVVQWGWEFENDILPLHLELKKYTIHAEKGRPD